MFFGLNSEDLTVHKIDYIWDENTRWSTETPQITEFEKNWSALENDFRTFLLIGDSTEFIPQQLTV
jgi:hypothetical protein